MVSTRTLNHGFDDNDRLPIEVSRRKQGQYTKSGTHILCVTGLHFATCIVSGIKMRRFFRLRLV